MNPAAVLAPVSFADIPFWAESVCADKDAIKSALDAFRRSAREILDTGHGFRRLAALGGEREDWLSVCKAALTAEDPRTFFEDHFDAFRVADPERPQGLFTGYFEPEAEGSLQPGVDYPVPIYRKPDDLVAFPPAASTATGLKYGRYQDGKPLPFWTRQQIEEGALANQGLEIAFLKRWEDAFFIHIQGSGRVRLPDGSSLRLAYAAKSGLPYTGIGAVLVEQGAFAAEQSSMQAIRQWMSDYPGKSRQLMWRNQSFVFFRAIAVPGEDLGALGAQQVFLTPRTSLAVDRSVWAFGTPLVIDSSTPPESRGGASSFHRLMIAQDTGSAIKGTVRGDVYWGWGDQAAQIAGHMKSAGSMHALLPKPVVRRLGLRP